MELRLKYTNDITNRPINTPDDCEFTREEIRGVIEGMNNKKAPGEDGITAEIHKQTFKILPKSITAMSNGCLKKRSLPGDMEDGKNHTDRETRHTK